MKLQGVRIAGTGRHLPERILTNDELSHMVDTSDEWITTRTGIRERHIAAAGETTSMMAAAAARAALEAAGLEADDLDMIIVGTLTPDKPFPNTASLVQRQIGAVRAACFSLEAACSGFIYGLEMGSALIRSGLYRRILVIGAEKLSSITNWTDRNTCVLFGDGAGAVILEACPAAEDSYLGSCLGSDGNYHDILHQPVGGCARPYTADVLGTPDAYLQMNGREVFKLAVNNMAAACETALQRAGKTCEDIDWVVPHQANSRIIDAVGEKLRAKPNQVYSNVARYGNTSAASVPVALDEMVRTGQLKRGQTVMSVAFGGGLTWGAYFFRY